MDWCHMPIGLVAETWSSGDIYAGLWYPIGVAVMTLVIGLLFLKDTRGVDMVTGSGVAIQQET
jgi:hypothetical protein